MLLILLESVRKYFSVKSLEILFNEGLCRIEDSNLICDANHLNGFCMEWSFTGRCF